MKVFAFTNKRNVGDTLTLPVLQHFLPEVSFRVVKEKVGGKLVGIGSILNNVRPGDTVWGTGAMFAGESVAEASRINFLALRGRLTEQIVECSGGQCSGVTGDPALLLPRMYSPHIEKRFEIGDIPHFIDYAGVGRNYGWKKDRCLIDVFLPWRDFVDRILACKRIRSSSLHGLVIAEAYGIPVQWVEHSKKVRGDGFKFHDYLTGTGRKPQAPGHFPPIENLSAIQNRLIDALVSA